MNRLLVAVYLCVLAITCCVVANAAVFYVDGDQADDSGAGTSWGTAKKTIGSAIMAAVSAQTPEVDEVWVKALSGGNVYNEHVVMQEGVSLYGGFDGTESAREDRDRITNVTVLDGTDLDNSVVTAGSGITNATYIDGFTIQNGPAGQCLPIVEVESTVTTDHPPSGITS